MPTTPATERNGRPLDAVLRPRSVAIVGASADPSKRGYQIIQALQRAGYAGAIHPVNPRGGEILGLTVHSSIADITQTPDLAVVCTPAGSAPGAVEECAARGVRAAVVLALGFREAGPDGEQLEARIRAVVARHSIRVVGPNTSGLLNVPLGLNLVGLRDVPSGSLALVVQSGNILLEQVTLAALDGGEGFTVCLGLGNMADVAWHDALDDLAADERVRAVLMYAEGFEHGRAFVDAATRAARRQPLALLKGGRSASGLAAARSHTGALASGPAVLAAALRAAGVTEVRRSDELRAIGTTLAWQPAVRRGDVAILSDGGGHAAVAADVLTGLGITLAKLAPTTQQALRDLLGPAAAVANPVDVAGATDRDIGNFPEALRLLLTDEGVGAVVQIGIFGGYAIRFDAGLAAEEIAVAHALAQIARASGRAFVVHSVYHAARSDPLDALRRAEVPVIGSLEGACAAVAALVERGRMLERPVQPSLPKPNRGGDSIIAGARSEARNACIEPESRALASRYGVPVVPATLCTTAEETAAAAAHYASPVAVRLVSATILHKTEAGAVRLNVAPVDAAGAFDEMRDAVARRSRARRIDPDVRGVLVSPMLPSPLVELIVGARRDPAFGPLLALGFGGVGVEAIGDVALRLLPTTRDDLLAALDDLRAAALLHGVRGRVAPDVNAIVALALALGDCLIDNPELSDIEANPIFAYSDRALAVDVRALLTGAAG